MASNFTISDLVGIAEGFVLFPLFALMPGYVLAWLLDFFEFKRRSPLARLTISVPLSIGTSPVLAYLLWHWSISLVWANFAVIWIGFLILLFHDRRIWLRWPHPSRPRIAFVAIVTGWIVLGTLSLIDLQFKDRLYFSLVGFDYMFRAGVTAAITNTGIPPHNPLFFPGQPFVLRYHYFWFILCSLVNQIDPARVSPRQAMMAGTLWSGIGLIALIPMYLRFFQPKGARNLDRRMLLGVGLLSVAGYYIVPVVFVDAFTRNVILPAFKNVAPLPDQVLWVPHHVAGLIACLTGLLLLWHKRDLQRRPRMMADVSGAIAAGVIFASGLGLSVYVTLTVAVLMIVWIAVQVLRRQFREGGLTCLAGAVALIFSLPYIRELLGGSRNASGGPLLKIAVRVFPVTDYVISSLHPSSWVRTVASVLALPLAYFLEVGFFFFVALLQWQKMRASKPLLNHPELCGFVMAASSLILCSFVRSSVINANDLGLRGVMLFQFVLLLWGVEFLDEGLLNQSKRNLLTATLALGVAGTVYDVCVFRTYTIIADNSSISRFPWLSPESNLGARTFALREAYEELKRRLPPEAVVQHNPDSPFTDPGDLPHGLYSGRQSAAETLQCGTAFGGDPNLCQQTIGRILELFEKPGAVAPDRIDAACDDLSIDVLMVKDTDPVWSDKTGWVWSRPPLIANRYARAFLCGGRSPVHP